jgi:hypothetical protein
MSSGFAVAVSFLFWAAIMFYSPRYFRVSGNVYATLALYAVGTLSLMIAVAGKRFELSSPKLGHYFTVLVSEGPSSIPWAAPSGELWVNAGLAGAFLVGMGFFHVAAELLGRWRILEVLLKMVALLFAGLATLGLAGVVDELIMKPLFVVPADRLASGQTVPVDHPGTPQDNEPSDGSGPPLGGIFNVVIALGTLVSTISALAAGWGFVFIRVRNILKLLRQ